MSAMNEDAGSGASRIEQKTGVPKISPEITISAAEQSIRQEAAAANGNAERRNEIIRGDLLDPEIAILLIASMGRFFPDATVAQMSRLAGHPVKKGASRGLDIAGATGATIASGSALAFIPKTVQDLEPWLNFMGIVAGSPRIAAATSAASLLSLLALAVAFPLRNRFKFITEYRTQSLDAAGTLEKIFGGGQSLTDIRTLAADGRIDELKKACDETIARIVTGNQQAKGEKVTTWSTTGKNTTAAAIMLIAASVMGMYGAAGIKSGQEVAKLFKDEADKDAKTAVKRGMDPIGTAKEFSGRTWQGATFAKGADQFGDAFKRLEYNLQVIFGSVKDAKQPSRR